MGTTRPHRRVVLWGAHHPCDIQAGGRDYHHYMNCLDDEWRLAHPFIRFTLQMRNLMKAFDDVAAKFNKALLADR